MNENDRLNDGSYRQKWIMHAYDYFLNGDVVLYVSPDGNICTAVMIRPLDRGWTQWRFVGLSSLSGEIITFDLDEYQDVLVIKEEEARCKRCKH